MLATKRSAETLAAKQLNHHAPISCPLLIVSAVAASLAIALTSAYLFIPSPIDATEYRLPQPIPIEDALTVNERLANAELLFHDQVYGPESIAINRKNGLVYTGLKTGLICEIDLSGEPKIVRAVRLTSHRNCDGTYDSMSKCGRPLGMRFHPKTNELFVLDAYLGLFSIKWESEEVHQLFAGAASTSHDDSTPLTRYLNDFDFLPDGRMVISESSTKFDDRDFIYDLLEHRPNGRLLEYNPTEDKLSVLLNSLYFPNGVQVVRGEVLVAEMGKARILKYFPSSDNVSVFIDNLPGYPDNIRLASDKNLWVPLAAIRSENDNWLAVRPGLRTFLAKLLSPKAMHAVAEWMTINYGLILKVDSESGKLLDSLHDRMGRISAVTVAVEDGRGNILLGSDDQYYIARLKL